MSQCLRYRNPIICDHLASQYVSGYMTTRVRSRMESLLRYTPELNRAVALWADHFADIQSSLPAVSPSPDVWSAISDTVDDDKQEDQKQDSTPWWRNLFLWQSASFAGLAASLLLAITLLTSPASPVLESGPNYVAAMSQGESPQPGDIQLVISAYKKASDRPSRLHFQWSKHHQQVDTARSLHLWAESRETGELTYIGVELGGKQAWDLTKPSWLAVANSSRLLITSSAERPSAQTVLFSGPCVQLNEWKS